MTIIQLITELILLLKRNIKTIIFIMLTSVLIVAVGLFFLKKDADSINKKEESEDSSATFEMYIENEDNTPFVNQYILEILITQPKIISNLEERTGVDIQSELEDFAEENELYYSNDDPINVERNSSSNVLKVSITIDDSENNKQIAEELSKWLVETEEPLLEERKIFLLSEVDFEETKLNSEVIESNISLFTMARYFIGILFLSFLLGNIYLIFKELLGNKINYSFSYSKRPQDTYLNMSKMTTEQIAFGIIQNYKEGKNIILSENKLSKKLIDELNSLNMSYSLYQSISEIPIDIKYSHITIVVDKFKTSKKWYTFQLKGIELLNDVEVRVVEI